MGGLVRIRWKISRQVIGPRRVGHVGCRLPSRRQKSSSSRESSLTCAGVTAVGRLVVLLIMAKIALAYKRGCAPLPRPPGRS